MDNKTEETGRYKLHGRKMGKEWNVCATTGPTAKYRFRFEVRQAINHLTIRNNNIVKIVPKWGRGGGARIG